MTSPLIAPGRMSGGLRHWSSRETLGSETYIMPIRFRGGLILKDDGSHLNFIHGWIAGAVPPAGGHTASGTIERWRFRGEEYVADWCLACEEGESVVACMMAKNASCKDTAVAAAIGDLLTRSADNGLRALEVRY